MAGIPETKENRTSFQWKRWTCLTMVAVLVTVIGMAMFGTALEPKRSPKTSEDELPSAKAPGVSARQDGVAAENAHPLEPTLKLARASLTEIHENLRDYTAVLVKRERINGRLTDHQFVEAKIRSRKLDGDRLVSPLAVYLRFIKPKSTEGREVIWVEGQNKGRLVAHEGGFKNLLTVKLMPDNPLAMFGQRYPITEIGIENLIVKLIVKGEHDLQYGECKVKIRDNAKVDDRVCTLIEVVHPIRRRHFEFHRARIFIDSEHHLPIRYASWTWPETEGGEPVLEEEYTYMKLRTNVGLTDRDFDPENPKYKFP